MLKNRKMLLAFLALAGAAFFFGITQLFQLRFEQGDVYPPYSSLRADPLGTKIFYDSLDQLPNVSVDRLYEPLNKVTKPRSKTLFVLGAEPWMLNRAIEQDASDLNQFMLGGGRLVVSFQPVAFKTWSIRRREKQVTEEKETDKDKQSKPEAKEPKKKKWEEEEVGDFKFIPLAEKWGFKFEYKDLKVDENDVTEPVDVSRVGANTELPQTLSWHTALYFDDVSEDWEKIYLRGRDAVVIERAFGKGSLVLASDSYFASNEAMRRDRHADLLAWLVGTKAEIIFDETHLGVQADPGIAALARKYRLHGLIVGLVLLAGLFVWKNSSNFVPPPEESFTLDQSDVVTGKDSTGGFINLLRRSISPAEILPVCFAEWKKSCAHGRLSLAPRVQEVEKLIRDENAKPPRERNPVQTYQRIATILSKRKST